MVYGLLKHAHQYYDDHFTGGNPCNDAKIKFTGRYVNPNAGDDHFRVPVEDEGWKATWRNISPILRERMNDTDLQAASVQILGLSNEEMAETKNKFQTEINRIDREVGKPA